MDKSYLLFDTTANSLQFLILVNHDQTVDEVIAAAEHEEVSEVAAEVEGELPAESEADPPNLEEKVDQPVPDPEVDYSQAEDEIISLPHLPDPKYDEEGDVVWFPRIIGGSRAQSGEFPSKVSLQSRSGSHFCGGNLITNNHVLSASHCVVTEDGLLLNPTAVSLKTKRFGNVENKSLSFI